MDKISWCRVVMEQDVLRLSQKILEELDNINVLEISGNRWSVTGENNSCKHIGYPEIDICADKIDGKYNLIVAEMVFEHLKYPYRAGKNIYDTLEDGGYFLLSVPCLYPIHRHPIDCCRWTGEGLMYFLNECGFQLENIYTNSWGNRECLDEICKADGKDGHVVIYENQSLGNEVKFPITVWGMAQK